MNIQVERWDGSPLHPEQATNKIYEFASLFGTNSLLLAAHAAVVELLTNEIITLIRTNFLTGYDKYDAVLDSNILFGTLTYGLGSGVYKMDKEVRKHLITSLDAWSVEKNSDSEIRRSSQVAHFIRYYIQWVKQHRSEEEYDKDFLNRIHWVALAYDQPELAAQELARHMVQFSTTDKIESTALQFTRIRPLIELPLSAYTQVLNYARFLENLTQEKFAEALAVIKTTQEDKLSVGNVSLPAAKDILTRHKYLQTIEKYSSHPEIPTDGKSDIKHNLRNTQSLFPNQLESKKSTPHGLTNTTIHEAILKNNIKLLKRLLSESTDDIDKPGENGKNALHLTAERNAYTMMELLCSYQANINAPDLNYATALMLAAENGYEKITSILIRNGANLNLLDNTGKTCLHAAAEHGHLSLINLLIDHGADVNQHSETTLPPLFIAVKFGRFSIVDTLLRHGARIDIIDQNGNSLLCGASLGGNPKIIKLLYQFGLKISTRNKHGHTPVMFAAFYGQVKAFDCLISYGASHNETCKDKTSSLHMAANAGKLDMVKHILTYHSSIPDALALVADHRWTPIRLAALRGYRHVVEYFVASGDDINTDTDGWNLLHLCSQELSCENSNVLPDYTDLVKFLIQKGLDVNRKTKHGETPLHISARHNAKDTIITLIKNKQTLLNETDSNGCTALLLASKNACTDSIDALLTQEQLDVNLTVDNKQALLFAVEAKSQAAVKALLKSPRIDRNHQVKSYTATAIWHAAKLKQWDIFNLLCSDTSTGISARTISGDTLLHTIIATCRLDNIDSLIRRDFDVNVYNSNYDTPLITAIRSSKEQVVEHLLGAGSHSGRYPLKNRTSPLTQSIRSSSLPILRTLISHSADLDEKDDTGKTLLHHAVANKHALKIVQFLLSSGLDATAADKQQRTPLHDAIGSENTAIIDELIKHNVHLDAQDHEGMTALHMAIRARNPELCSYLIRNGAKTDITTFDGWSILHLAALHNMPNLNDLIQTAPEYLNHIATKPAITPLQAAAEINALEACQQLVENGADKNLSTDDKLPPLFLTVKNGFTRVEEYLINAGARLTTMYDSHEIKINTFKKIRENENLFISQYKNSFKKQHP